VNGNTPWSEQFNSMIRGGITIALVLVFCYLSILKIIDETVLSNMVATVVGFWFGSRAAAAPTKDGPTTTTTVKPSPDATPVVETVTKPTPPPVS
jgi:hypothetical protein